MIAPELSASDIEREVERIFARDHRAYMTALFGRGSESSFSATGRKWKVIPTGSEMQMRAAMPTDRVGDNEGRVFLVDWTDRPLPLDLACRLASGRVFQVSRDTRLAGLFGARRTEPGLMGSGLASVLLSGEITGFKKVSGIALTKQDATRHFLNAWAGFPLTEPLTAANLAVWCLSSQAGPGLIQKSEKSDTWRKLRSELREFVEHEAGTAALLAWEAFEKNNVRRFLQVAVLVDAHNRLEDAVADGLLQGRLSELAPGYGIEVLAARKRLSLHDLIGGIFDGLSGEMTLSLLQDADTLITNDSFASTRVKSPWLPSSHSAREENLAGAMNSLVDDPTVETLRKVTDALNEIDDHSLDSVLRTQEQRETRQLAVRLAAYLVWRSQQPQPGPGPAYQRAVDLADAFASEGGFVDWCRGRLRGPLPFHQVLNAAAHRVLRSADDLRRLDDKEFAESMLEWYRAGQPSSEVIPIEQVTRQLVAGLVTNHPGRKVLLIMMDGMSWAAAVQLLHRMEGEQWAPILWRPKGSANHIHLPPVLASLPTLTNVSRAAFFSGRANAKDGHKHTQEDSKRWASNKALIQANGEAALPELILRSQLMDGEVLHKDVRKAIDSDHNVVGVVVNAIDEELRGSTQVMRDYSTTVIKPLAGLMAAASGAERIVVLASDHGHVLGDAMKTHGQPLPSGSESGKRWRSLKEDDAIYPFELELPSSVWRPKGASRMAAIWDESVCHSQPAYGEHGGLSLAEVIAPVLIVAPEWLAQLKAEEGMDLETRPFPIPAWWDLEVRPARGAKAEAGIPERSDDNQQMLPMPGVEKAVVVQPEPAIPTEEPALVRGLRKSKVFAANTEGKPAHDVETVLRCLAVLVNANGALGDQEFARRCQTRPHRVGGLVARMGSVLNIDGYAMVEHDRAGRQVTLHQARLVTQYGLK